MSKHYSRAVIALRIVLIVAMIALTVTVIIWAWPKPEVTKLPAAAEPNELAAPRFIIKEEAFTHTLSGQTARYSQDQKTVWVQNAQLESKDSDQTVTVLTPQGIYTKDDARIEMQGGVKVTATNPALELQGEQGQVNIQTHIMHLSGDVTGESATVQVRSQTADYHEADQIINFRGNVHVVLQP